MPDQREHEEHLPGDRRTGSIVLEYRLGKVEEGVDALHKKLDTLLDQVVTKEYYNLTRKPYIERFENVERLFYADKPSDIRADLTKLEARLNKAWWSLITAFSGLAITVVAAIIVAHT